MTSTRAVPPRLPGVPRSRRFPLLREEEVLFGAVLLAFGFSPSLCTPFGDARGRPELAEAAAAVAAPPRPPRREGLSRRGPPPPVFKDGYIKRRESGWLEAGQSSFGAPGLPSGRGPFCPFGPERVFRTGASWQ